MLLFSFIGLSQEFTSFTRTYPSGDNFRYQTNIKGDLTFISNQILNRETGTITAETPYNNLATNNNNNPETGGRQNYNDFKNMQYIDVDADASTFSSSTTTLAFPEANCNRIRYAGLYWSATYPSATANGSYNGFNYTPNTVTPGTGRQNDFNQVRFSVPGSVYVDVVADEILYDGFTNPATQSNSPYACYADVTALVTALADPQGDYTVANIRATTGGLAGQGGSSGGWTLVIVYENPSLSGKLITTFDGFARVTGTNTIPITYDGFTTIPAGPVRAGIGVAALEGDFRIGGDGIGISTPTNPTFTSLNNGANPANNFFNSNITLNGVQMPGRTPSSLNTLGFDADIFALNNPANSVIANDETSATFRFNTNGDQFYPYFNSFNIEIIEPNIILEKRVEDIAGNDITGQGVNLGQILDYVLSFENTGNDDATNYTIRDILPLNVTLDEANLNMPAGTTYTYDPATREVVFSIPDNIVEIGDPTAQIRMRVMVAENCFDFVDACTDLIENVAFSTYEGVINDNQITDDPSVSDFDACGFVTPGATNFLLDDLSDCNFTRTVQLCGLDALLDAGDNFDSYVWVRDDNNNGEIDASDTVQDDGDPDGDPSTLSVTQTGTYIVDKIVADPCKGFKEIITVERFGTTQNNPLVDYFNNSNSDADATNDIQGEIVQCSIDGDLLPKIFLCGASDTQLLEVNIPDAQSLSWELLDETSCTAAPDDCANKNLACTWNQVGTGGNYTANAPGKYRLVISYSNGCFSNFYFDVFQNLLDVQHTSRDIFCATDGNITITNLGATYGYQLLDVATGTIVVPFSANNGPSFDIGTNGAYRVDVVQLDSSGNPIPGACIFSTPDIGIIDRDFQVDIETAPANCNAQGSIKIDILNVRPDYTYVLRLADGTLVDDETAQSDNTWTFNVNPGNYIVEASTADGCTFSQNVTVDDTPDPTVLAVTTRDIGCTAGMITLTGSNGFPNPDYNFAIWSHNGSFPYSDISDVPGSEYQANPIFTFGYEDHDSDPDTPDQYIPNENGTYVFVIVDANNCFALSNEVTINDNGAMTATVTDDSPVSCSGTNDASITINTVGGVAPFEYSIDAGTTTQPSQSFVGLSAGTYNILVSDSSGCTLEFDHVINEPFPLSASSGVSRDASCDPMGAEVRITNVVGGTAPYEYSFDGGNTYGTSTTAILPPGTYTLIVRDATGCSFPMTVEVEDVPTPPLVTLTPEVSYLCDGTATVTATPDNTTYDYTYALDGVPNTPPESNVFNNVPPGTYTVSTNYVSQTPPSPSLLLTEDFGIGNGTISSPNTVGYFYEDQTTGTHPNQRPGDTNRNINDYEYAVTNRMLAPFGAWVNPVDHTAGNPDGRYLVINVGTPAPGQIIYTKTINDIIPNQPLRVSLWIMNLLEANRGNTQLDPNLTIEVRDPATGNVVQSIQTGIIPKANNNTDWIEFAADLDPGTFPSLDFVVRTEIVGNSGNDLAIDDITVFQTPEVCERTVETSVVVEAGRVFAANGVSSTNVSCNGLTDGTITFEAENFDATAGFDYSVDGGTTWINSTTSPVTTNAIYGAGLQRIELRKADDNSCTSFVEATISEPTAVVANASITTPINCTNGGATITAGVSGGTPGYVYQLEDDAGNAIAPYDFTTNGSNTVFTGIVPGDYIVRARDNNGCEDPIDVALTVADTNDIVFDSAPTTCYSGANDASIVVNVTDGNGGYTFSINGNPWVAPAPTTGTTHTFNNLANGTYTINVRDSSGCIGVLQNVTIDPQLTVTASAQKISACATGTDITITATGGDANYVYAVIPNGNTVLDSDFSTTNPVNVTTAGSYDVYVRDNGGAADYCQDDFTIIIIQDASILITPTPTAVSCFGGADGAISVVVDSGGEGPFEYSIDGGTNYQVSNTFNNLTAGTYPVQVQDANNCETTAIDVVVNEPAELRAEATQTQDYTCNQLGQITVGSVTPTSGGSGDYQYSINGGSWTATTTGGHTFIDLTDGTYSILVRDANAISCETTITDVIIAPLPIEPVLTTSIDYNCDGTGNITITPFNSSFTYILDGIPPGQTGTDANIFTNVAVGSHTITVNYGSDCSTDISVIVEDGNAFEASITAFENLNCNADSSGTITITADNFGTGGYEYSLDAVTFVGPFTSPEQITGLDAQAYTITVRDVDNPVLCSTVLNQVLTEPTPVVASATITEEFTCDNTGATITAGATGGTPTYEYRLEDTAGGVIRPYQTPNTFTNVTAGDYIVRVRDSNGCENPINSAIVIVAPVGPEFALTPTACYSGANDASILVDITTVPGNGGFQFNIDAGPWITPSPSTASSYTFENLANGTYSINVRDAFGCIGTPETITINPQLTANATLDQDLTCLVDASITVNANGGFGAYTYEWSNTSTGPWNTSGFSTNTFTTNTDGTYFFRVTDSTSPTACSVVTNAVVVTPAELPVITSITPTNLNCNGDASGSLDIVVDNNFGLAPYVLEVVNTSTSFNYGTQTSGLTAGNYSVTLTDAKGCVDTETAVISEPDPINYTATSVPITCDSASMNTNPGSITISGTTGGTPEYTYILSANNGIPTQTHTTTSGNRDHTFDILDFGIYQIDIVDANGCSSFSTEIIASPPNDLDIDVSTATANCSTGGTAIVTVGAAVGSGNYEFAILETFTSPYSSTYVGPDATPVGNTDTATFTGLTPGITYTFVVHDLTTNCYFFETADAPIDSPSNMTNTLDVVANVTCTGAADGNISFTFDNFDSTATAVNYEIFNSQSNVTTGQTGTSSVNPPAGPVTVTDFATLPPGEYYLLLSEVGGPFDSCTVFGGEFTIRESVNLLDVAVTVTKNDNCNANAGVLTATGQFGTAPYEYQFLPSGSTAPTAVTWAGSSNNVFNGEGGNYDVYIKDANDCIQTDSILLPTDASPEISLAIVDECVPEGTYQVVVTLDVAGISPYSLSVNGAPFQNITFNGSGQYTISNLSTGAAQTVEISDLNGCGETETFTIQPILQFNAVVTTLIDCETAPNNNAEITINITAGSGNYDYEITGPVNEARTALPSNPFVWTSASAPGTYRVTIYDNGTAIPNCSRFINVEVQPAVVPEFTHTFEDITCNGANDGSITLTETLNGINPYTYTISPVAGTFNAATKTFENLPPDTYTVTGRGTNNCPLDITGIIIGEPAVISVPAATVVEFGCTAGNNQNDASISVNEGGISGGSGTYVRYEFINDQGTVAIGDDIVVQNGSATSYTETDIAGGTYIINVYDDNGCIGSATATIQPFVAISNATVTVDQTATCAPGNDGQVTIGYTATPTTPVPSITYSVVGTDNAYSSLNQPSAVFTGLGIGNYEVTVTNTNTSCFIQTVFEINDPNTFEIDTTTTDVICFGDNGSVSFTISDAVNPYSAGFSWQIYNSQGTVDLLDDVLIASANGVSANVGPTAPFAIGAGEYRVEITQDSDPSCTNNALFVIAGPNAAITANTDVTPITCIGNDGVIEIIDVLGGWGIYQYYVGTVPPADATAYGSDPTFENLAPGTYEAWVIDRNGCQEEIQNTIVLVDPTPITADLQINQPNCTNLEGEIEVINEVGGQGSNYRYQLQILNTTTSTFEDLRPIQTAYVFSGLGAGEYQVIVSDQWSCFGTTNASIVLFEPITPLATVVKSIDCTVGNESGAITISQTGGSGNFDYEVRYPGTLAASPADDANTTGVFTGLILPGDYTFTITDQDPAQTCVVTIVQNLQPAIIPVLTVDSSSDVTCNAANDGFISVSVTDNGVGPYTFEIVSGDGSSIGSPILPTSSTDISATFSGLTGTVSGITYTIRTTGTNNCFVEETQTIFEPEAIANVNATVVEFSCTAGNNSNNATITIDASITGGSGTYVRYEFINTDTATTVQDGANNSYTETNFAGGNYTINVYDDEGCIGSTTASIVPFDELQTATVVVIDPISCVNGGEDIRIDVIGSLSDSNTNPANYEYRLLPSGAFQPSNLFNDLAPGSYAFEIRNVNTNCRISRTHFIADPNTFDVEITKLNDAQCFGEDGQIQLAITDATYTGGFVWMIFDTNGTPADRTDDGPFILDGTWPDVGPTGAIPVPAGTYIVEIMQNGFPQCTQTEVFTITTPTELTAIASEESNVSCTNDQGSILVDPSGGVGPYSITIDSGTQTFTETNVQAFLFQGLSEGTFAITVTDMSGCSPNTPVPSITLIRPDNIVANIPVVPTLSCFNDSNASITAVVDPRTNPATSNYLYSLEVFDATGTTVVNTSANQTSPTFSGLSAGFYRIRIIDEIGCDGETNIVEILNPEEVTALLVRTSPLTCDTGVELQLTAGGGSGSYSYSEDNITFIPMAGNTVNITQANAGTYQYWVRDEANNCEAVLSNEITEDEVTDPILSAPTIINVACTGESTGSISTEATGGMGDYRYSLYRDAALTDNYIAPGHFQATGQFNNLPAGTYYIEVVSNDCEASIVAEITEEPLGVDFEAIPTDVTCAGEDDGLITITNNGGGTGMYQYAITNPNGTLLKQFSVLSSNPTYVFTDLEGSAAGTVYRIIAQDENGCFEDFIITIFEPEVLSLNTVAEPVTCSDDTDGTITLTIIGGTAPFTAALNSTDDADYVPVTDGHVFTDLAAGFYEIRVRDAGCEPVAAVAEVGIGVNLDAEIEPVYECNGNTLENYINITLVDSTVIGDVMYAMDSSDPVNAADLQLNPDFRNLSSGMHTLTIVHSNGCEKRIDFEIEDFQPLELALQNNIINVITAQATGGKEAYTYYFNDIDNGSDNTYNINQSGVYVVRVVDENGCEVVQSIEMEFIDIEIPNFFSPDGDGLNDKWIPRNQEGFPEILTIIFDRYGREVYRMGLNDAGWGGIYNAKELPTGDYWYIIKLRGENDPREFVGHFTLYR